MHPFGTTANHPRSGPYPHVGANGRNPPTPACNHPVTAAQRATIQNSTVHPISHATMHRTTPSRSATGRAPLKHPPAAPRRAMAATVNLGLYASQDCSSNTYSGIGRAGFRV
jgi:hypothetical protein